jgi:predicted amidohydrolase YtcJ
MLLKTLAVAAMAVNVVIVNARVWTGDARRPWADAVAVEGDRIKAVGSSAEIMKLAAARA